MQAWLSIERATHKYMQVEGGQFSSTSKSRDEKFQITIVNPLLPVIFLELETQEMIHSKK